MGFGLYNVTSPLPYAQAAQRGAAQSYAAMSKKESRTTTTTKDDGRSTMGMIGMGILGGVMGFATGGIGSAAVGAASGMMNYMS